MRVPTLLIAGWHDCVTPVAMFEDIARCLPGAQLAIFENVGHFAHVEEPARFHRVIRTFVRSQP
jgi:pimeloyl-ACP methyl ester carboxylesterase